MSKELEALNILSNLFGTKLDVHTRNQLNKLNTLLRQVFTPPTADDVCKLYELLYRTPLIYNKTMKRFEEIKGGRAKGRYIATLYPFGLKIYHPLKLHLITLIGKFYENEVKKDE